MCARRSWSALTRLSIAHWIGSSDSNLGVRGRLSARPGIVRLIRMGTHMNEQEPVDPGTVASVMDLLRTLVRALRVSTRAVEREIGISGAQLFVLQQLAGAPARSVNELAERTRTHQSSVSTVVSRLAERGLVAREPAAQDARRMEIALTEAGRALLDDAPRTAQVRMVEALAAMPPAQARALADGLSALVRQAGLQDLPASFFFEDEGGAHG
jgi:DNA-binding MarR family transcriptional regulator